MMNKITIDQKIQRTEKEITRLEHQKKLKQHEAKSLNGIAATAVFLPVAVC